MVNGQQQMLDIYFQEYSQLKHEQTQRVGFRDNLLYVTLGLYGGILGFTLGEKANPYALLILPWVSLVLGWTYLVNDQKITAIGRYIRYTLVENIGRVISATDVEPIFGWEIIHRIDEKRKRRKIEQLIIDEIAFVFSGIAALIAFQYLLHPLNWAVQLLSFIELVPLVILGLEIFLQADLTKGR